ncbi:MAG TPA: flagellar biosynthetic protein FliR [Dongiaceae bacterium]|nr:flagellar biosynthetic protein FliR [Dongiaceae bacterium]
MNPIDELLLAPLVAVALVFCRLGAALMLTPGLGEATIPARLRLVFALIASISIQPLVLAAGAVPEHGMLIRFIIAELTAGLFLGALTRIYLLALDMVGSFMATQMGLSNALVNDPITAQQSAALTNLLGLAAVALIFAAGLDREFLEAFVGSYTLIPTGTFRPDSDAMQLFLRVLRQAMGLALQLSAPFALYGTLFFATLGILSRLMPQLQVFFIAVPLQLLAGTALLLVTVGFFFRIFLGTYGRFLAGFW